jgi:anti-anti-sigma factor
MSRQARSSPVEIRRLTGATVEIRPVGGVDLDNAYLLRDAMTAVLVTAKPQAVVLDLRAVPFIDTVGIGALVSCFYSAAACHVPITVTRPQPPVYRQLWVCGLVGLFGLPVPHGLPAGVAP